MGRRTIRAVLVIAVLAAVVAVVPAAPAGAAPALSVSPNAGLVDRQRVTVERSGFGRDAFALLIECQAGATSTTDCDQPDFDFESEPSPNGTVRFTVDASIVKPDGTRVDCRTAPGTCSLAAFDYGEDEGAILASVPLDFAAGAPLAPAPTLALEPAADLVDEQTVRLSGGGYRRDTFLVIFRCAAGVAALDDCSEVPVGFAETRGRRLTGRVRLEATFITSGGQALDCRTAGACSLLAGNPFEPEDSGTVVLPFDATAELGPRPRLTAEPSADLANAQEVILRGRRFERESFSGHQILLCPPNDRRPEACRLIEEYANVRDDGRLQQRVRLPNVVRTEAGVADCRVAPGCDVVVGDLLDPDDLGVAPVVFDPTAPLAKPPRIRVDPSGPVREGSVVTVRGLGFRPGRYVEIGVCVAGATTFESCGSFSFEETEAGPRGRFSVALGIPATISGGSGEATDCRAPGACEIVAGDIFGQGELARRPLTVDQSPGRRYLDQVFTEVEVTRDVQYTTAIGADGRPIDLKLDVYRPVGDTVQRRPAVVWFHGGGFTFGSKEDMRQEAEDSARRGYVGVSVQYRLSPATDGAAIQRSYEDGRTAVRWLRDNAATYGIAKRAIAAGGYSAGAFTAINLAYAGRPSTTDRSRIGAAVSLAGARSIGVPQRGEAPLLMFHGDRDGTVPYDQATGTCDAVNRAGVRCRLITFPGADHFLPERVYRAVETARFLYRQLLVPEGFASAP